MNVRPIFVIATGLLVLSILISYNALTFYIQPYLTISQVLDNSKEYQGREIQIIGVIANESVQIVGSSLRFLLADDESAIQVNYEGPIPQNFQEGIQAVAIGRLTSPSQFEAKSILTKCPSKYESGEQSSSLGPLFILTIVVGAATAGYFLYSTVLQKEGKTKT